jgi:hypothetical protein
MPLHEQDVLFLLLSRYAQASQADVYMEIRRPGDFHVYDSTILEPLVSKDTCSLTLSLSIATAYVIDGRPACACIWRHEREDVHALYPGIVFKQCSR